ncbi:MAG: hypothetical protein LC541_11850 [Candidatus Thiodiazotropha sp.]|nr:hypothetical protein [Candidatus Thiodiazotropha sp.]MCM8883967.1 hypothetical protein [Candidatus Thiodiazotropha sp.]
MGSLKSEAPDQAEIDGLLESAKRRLKDASVEEVSEEGRFLSAYGAAHALSVAAMRWYGYRSSERYLVFQCLEHTVGLDNVKWRVLDQCHKQRNLAEYEGQLEISPQLLEALIDVTSELLDLVASESSIS